jgi:hypothetical protein
VVLLKGKGAPILTHASERMTLDTVRGSSRRCGDQRSGGALQVRLV